MTHYETELLEIINLGCTLAQAIDALDQLEYFNNVQEVDDDDDEDGWCCLACYKSRFSI